MADDSFKRAAELGSIRSTRRLKWVDYKIKTGALEDAKGILEDITKQAPDYVPPWAYLAQIAFAERKYDDCRALITKVLARDYRNYEALFLSARIRLTKGEAAEAIVALERMNTIYARAPQLKYELAIAYLLNKDAVKATSNLHQAISLDPTFAEAILLLAELNIRQGDPVSAITSLLELTQKRSEIGEGYLLLAEAYRAKGSLDDTVSVYRRMAGSFPRNPKAPFLMGLILRQQNKTAEARKAFEKAMELAPDDVPVLEQLVDVDLADKQLEAAVERIQKQIGRNPKAPGPMFLLAKVRSVQGDMQAAEAALLKAIDLEPGFTPAYTALAQMYIAANNHQKAVEKLEGIISRNPNDVTALMQIGTIQEQMKDFAKARESYEKVLKLRPQFSPVLNNLAYLYSERLGQLGKAYELARKARDLSPHDPFAADTLGWIPYRRGEYAWALSLCQESAERMPAVPEVQFHLGMTHYMMGEEELARIAFQRALQLKMDFPGADEAERRLSLLDMDVNTVDQKAVAELEKRLVD